MKMTVSRDQNRDKHVVRVGVKVWGLRWLGWTQEHKNHVEKTQWFGIIWSLRLAADDPYTQKHPKSRGLQQSVKEEDLVGG